MADGLFQAWIIGATVESQSWKEKATQDITRIWRGVLSAEWKVGSAQKQMPDSSFTSIAKCSFSFLWILPSEIYLIFTADNLLTEITCACNSGGNLLCSFVSSVTIAVYNDENESSIKEFFQGASPHKQK